VLAVTVTVWPAFRKIVDRGTPPLELFAIASMMKSVA
jgi:hypothetical protein